MYKLFSFPRFTFVLNIALLSFIMFSCEKEETLDVPLGIKVSQGTHMGVVHIEWPAVPNAHYNIERLSPGGNWLDAGYVSEPPFDDYGFNLPDNKIEPGTHYTYRIKSVSSDYDDSGFSETTTEGWSYVLKPIELKATDNGLSWFDPNTLVTNFLSLRYKITEIPGNDPHYETLAYQSDNRTTEDGHFSCDMGLRPESYYRIDVTYQYRYKNMDDIYAEGSCKNTVTISSDDISDDIGGFTSPYNWTDLGSLGNTNNGISFVKTKVYDHTFYTAILDNPSQGKPVLYKLNGSSFNNISNSYPDGLENNFGSIDFAVRSDTKYMSGISDSAYVFSYNGSWSSNLAADNFGYSQKPQDISIETDGDKIFAAIYTDDNNLVIKTWNHDTVWDENATIISSDALSSIQLTQLNGKVYLYYLKSNSDYNSTLYVKHYNGSSWVNDLEWSRDNIMNIKLTANDNSDLFFTSESEHPDDWAGSVFKITSASNAEDMLSDNENWIAFPNSITVNSSGDIMVVYTHVVSASQINPELAVYKDNIWTKVSGDYTGGVFPAEINHVDQEYYFIYGDAQNISGSYYPMSLKSNKLTKN